MTQKTSVEVLIGGKIYNLCGYESEEYLQKVAAYLNNKINEVSQLEGYKKQSVEFQNLLLELNVADDYFKVKKQAELLEEEVGVKDKELYDLKHELISSQIKAENTEEALEELQAKLNEAQKKIIRLETELSDLREQRK